MIVTYNCPDCGGAIEGNLTLATPKATCPGCGAESKIPPVPVGPGIVLGSGFKIEKQVRSSSVGDLFVAYQASMDRQVLIKVLPRDAAEDEDRLARFQREVQVAAALQHTNLLGAIDAGEDNGMYYLVSPHRAGQTLAELIRQKGSLPELEVVRIGYYVAQALQHIWGERRLVHRNVKPETILIPDDGQPMLTDLGIAKNFDTVDPETPREEYVVGTPQYMSPEQCLNRDLDYRADMYSLGCTLYEALVGQAPFDDDNPMTVLEQQVNEAAPPLRDRRPEVSARTAALVHALMEKDGDDRPIAWQDAIQELDACQRELRRGGKSGAAGSAKASNKPAIKAPGKADAGKKKIHVGNRAEAFQQAKPKKRGKGLLSVVFLLIAGGFAFAAYSYVKSEHAKADLADASEPGGLISTSPPLPSSLIPPTETPEPSDSSGYDSGYESDYDPADYPEEPPEEPPARITVEDPPLPPHLQLREDEEEQAEAPAPQPADTGDDEARERLEITLARVLNIMRGDHYTMAPSLIAPLMQDEQYATWRADLTRLHAVSSDIAGLPATVVADFGAQTGKTLNVRLKDRSFACVVAGVDGDVIRLQETVGGGSVMRMVRVADLHPAEVARHIGAIPADRRPYVAALIHARGGDNASGRAALAGTDTWLASRLRIALGGTE